MNLSSEWLDSLSVGKHVIKLVFQNGTAVVNVTVTSEAPATSEAPETSEAPATGEAPVVTSTSSATSTSPATTVKGPKTGDSSSVITFVIIMAVAVGTVVVVRKRKQLQ